MLRNLVFAVTVLAIAGTGASSAQTHKDYRATYIHKCTSKCMKSAGRDCATTCAKKASERGYNRR